MSTPFAFLFPGQGAQAIGMAADLAAEHREARDVFAAGSEALGRDVLAVCRDGPEEELSSTRVSQPAIFLHSMAALRVLGKLAGSRADFGGSLPALAAAGLSLGEYSALVFAGSLSFEDAIRIVGLRGQFMQEACDAAKGAMSSVIGLDASRVEEVVAGAKEEGLEVGVANYNSPDQTVISGAVAAVEETEKRLAAAGARRSIRLKVAGAYHSPLMASATRKLEPHLRAVKVSPPRVPFYSNATGAETRSPEEIRENLIRQVESPVRWVSIARGLAARGMRRAVEPGPGRVLAGLLRSIARDVEVVPAGTCDALLKLKDDPSLAGSGFASSGSSAGGA